MTKILAFAGSARKNSYNKKLVAVAANGAQKAGAEVTLIDLNDFDMPIFNEDLEAEKGMPEAAQSFKDLLIQHDGVLIASPEYNSGYSALLKNAIDWASRSAPGEAPLAAFNGKVAGIMAASPGGLGGLRGLVSLRMLLGNLSMHVIPNQRAVSRAFEAFNEEGVLLDERQQKGIESIGGDVAAMCAKLKA
ncbi:MAG: FMN reductase [Alteromonadaceae bacterium]|nr:FMN reductase [Alteromonadaceae bacterium]